MSEVKRYDEYTCGVYECAAGEYVKSVDFDRVTAERDAALEEVEALKHWRALALQFDNHRMRALWHLKTLVSDGAHYDAAAAFLAEPPVPTSELQQRLTAADEMNDTTKAELAWQESDNAELRKRADVLEGLLRRVYDADLAARHHQPYNVSKLMDEIEAALKPAEGGGDEA